MTSLSSLNIDWSQPDWKIASDLACTVVVAQSLRRAQGVAVDVFKEPKKLPKRRPVQTLRRRKNIALWRSWDWSVEDATLARDKELSRERIGQIRELLFGARGARPS